MATYETTGLWVRALGNTGNGGGDVARERLRVAYRIFWENAVVLAREIQRDLPGLTLHDEAHFDALWSRADQIAGPDFLLTPLEAFVFGGAILLHDNANSVAAFPGGLEAIKKTPEWADAEVEWLLRQGDDTKPAELSLDAMKSILFDVLRGLHAERARTLADFAVSVNTKTFHLLPDDQLRIHLGKLIGEIAASHHWSIATLPSRLQRITGALAGMPASWSVRPVLLACLLRCADACQIDQERAPDFLYAMLRLRGMSEQHWRAQNRLGVPTVESDEPSALIFTSTSEYKIDDADAWWLAHDAIVVANRELQGAAALLGDLRLPTFAITRIDGALSPALLATHVQVSGWRPVQAEVKITHVAKVVEIFGGQNLYGNDPSVPLRELIQNASDAIRFRRELEPKANIYEGSIKIRISKCSDASEDIWLDVEDDGLGMSEAVLTGPLIDFGASYISSALVKAERPGLLSKGRIRIGKYGIGFFSCFMVADEIIVTSRSYDAGLNLVRTLHFKNGLGYRPILLDECPDDFSATISTRIRLRLSTSSSEKILSSLSQSTVRPRLGSWELIGKLCPMIDVDVYLDIHGACKIIHPRRWHEEDRLEWLIRISDSDLSAYSNLPTVKAVGRLLSFVDPNDKSAGLATVLPCLSSGIRTVGGLRATQNYGRMPSFHGAIDCLPADPRRSSGDARAAAYLPNWATEQAKRIAQEPDATGYGLICSERISQFGGDPSPIAMIMLNRKEITLAQLVEFMVNNGAVYASVTPPYLERVIICQASVKNGPGEYRPENEYKYLKNVIESRGDLEAKRYYTIPLNNERDKTWFYTALENTALAKGFTIHMSIEKEESLVQYIGHRSSRRKDRQSYGLFVGSRKSILSFNRRSLLRMWLE